MLDHINLKITDEEFQELDLESEKQLAAKNFMLRLEELTR